MDMGTRVGISGVAVAVVTILIGYVWYRKNRALARQANALAEKSRRSSINLAQSADRNFGFDHFVAAIDRMQYGLCRDNTGDDSHKLSRMETLSVQETVAACIENGLDLLRNSVVDYDLVQPVLDYMTMLYLSSQDDDPIITPPSVAQYEACRDWLQETRRVCNEMTEGGSAQRHAEEILRQKVAAEDALDRGFTRKYHDAHLGVSVIFGDSVIELAERNADMMRAYAEYLPICKRRVDSWDRRAIGVG
jgi:hypothetical protein